MTDKVRDQLFDDFTQQAKSLITRKSGDYVADEDVLANFKLAGSIAGGDAKASCLHLIAVKVARLGSLLKYERAPNFEALDDTVVDLFNYTFLLKCILTEGSTLKKENSERGNSEEVVIKGIPESPDWKAEEGEKMADRTVCGYLNRIRRDAQQGEIYIRGSRVYRFDGINWVSNTAANPDPINPVHQ